MRSSRSSRDSRRPPSHATATPASTSIASATSASASRLRVGFDPARAHMLRHASALHDVGKIGIPDNVLLKPGALDADEWKIMQSHTAKGAEILAGSNSPLIQMAEAIARTHHERWDGTGYPSGLRARRYRSRAASAPSATSTTPLDRSARTRTPGRWSASSRRSRRAAEVTSIPRSSRAFLELAPELGEVARSEERDDLDLDSLPPLFEPEAEASNLTPGTRAPYGRRSSTRMRSPSNSNRSQPRTSNAAPSSSVARNVHSAAPRSPATMTSVSAKTPSG